MSISVQGVIDEVSAFAPLGEELVNMGLSVAGMTAHTMDRVTAIEAILAKLLGVVQSDMGTIIHPGLIVTPTPSAMVEGAGGNPTALTGSGVTTTNAGTTTGAVTPPAAPATK